MGELFLCYAGFVYYVIKYGYKLSKYGNHILCLWDDLGKFHFFSVYISEAYEDCGVVYTTNRDLEFIFKKNPDLLNILKTICVKRFVAGINKSSHCSIDVSERNKFETIIDEEIIRCFKRPV